MLSPLPQSVLPNVSVRTEIITTPRCHPAMFKALDSIHSPLCEAFINFQTITLPSGLSSPVLIYIIFLLLSIFILLSKQSHPLKVNKRVAEFFISKSRLMQLHSVLERRVVCNNLVRLLSTFSIHATSM